jgi:hypothetical protein
VDTEAEARRLYPELLRTKDPQAAAAVIAFHVGFSKAAAKLILDELGKLASTSFDAHRLRKNLPEIRQWLGVPR